MHNIEKSGFRRGQWVGYGHNTVWRISKNDSGYIAIDQDGKRMSIEARTLREMSAKLEKENPEIHIDVNSHNQREAGAYMKNPARVLNHLGEAEYQTFAGWKRAALKQYPGATMRGDKDIGALQINGVDVAEWDGEKGSVYPQSQVARFLKNPAPRAVTQDDINAAARGLRMLTMPQDDLKQLVKETNPDNFAGAVIIAAAKQMIGAKRQVGMFKKNPAPKTVKAKRQNNKDTRRESMDYRVSWRKDKSMAWMPLARFNIKSFAETYARDMFQKHPTLEFLVVINHYNA